MNAIKKRPWLLIVAAFIFLIAGWTAFINLAVKNQPPTVPLESEVSSQGSELRK